MHRRLAYLLAGLAVVVWAAGCSSAPQNPSGPSETPIITEPFEGSVNPNGAQTHFFLVLAAGDVTATIATLSGEGTVIGLELGTSADGINCQHVISNDSARQGSTMLGRASGGPAAFCVRLYDTGSLTESVSYALELVHP